MRDVSLGQYYAVSSPVHRLDPRFKMFAVLVVMVATFFITSFFVFGVAFIFIITVSLIARLPLLKVFRSLRAIFILMLFSLILTMIFSSGQYGEVVLWSWRRINIYISAMLNAGMLASRLVLLMLTPTILTLTTTPIELTDALESILKPLTLLKVPVYVFALIMSIALRMVPTLFEETDKIISAQKARCADFESANLFRRAKSLGSILIPLFISSFRRADELADALDSRCFNGGKRTRLKKLKFEIRDLVSLIIVLAFLFLVLLLRYNWWSFYWIIQLNNVVI
ncbi:MAG: energy-coupling factor transporter transmembrane protein EcfT [Firmicutes bacterium]|nr:energy-coupling factor transporter transmembrane protein EcfT [Bacillota bacterium]